MTHPHSFVEKLRLVELESAFRGRARPSTVLEIGAGTGWQARELERRGYVVEAVDIPDGTYTSARIWPVRDYDGRELPFANGSFDLVFSSNVLEHVQGLPQLLREQIRVLKSDGMMIHVVPSASWRFWTSLSYYPSQVFRVLRRLWPASSAVSSAHHEAAGGSRGLLSKLWAPAHGIATSPVSELSQFRRARWRRVFAAAGLEEVAYWPAGVFYSGYLVFGRTFPIYLRQALSRILGSSCHVFVLRKASTPIR
jgi:SAM-dependent methyltransferase